MIFWACPKCSSKLRAPETAIGRKLPCPKCQAVNVVPSQSSSTPAKRPGPLPQVGDPKRVLEQASQAGAANTVAVSRKGLMTPFLILAGTILTVLIAAAAYQFWSHPRPEKPTIAQQDLSPSANASPPIDVPSHGTVQQEESRPQNSESLPIAVAQSPAGPTAAFTLLDANEQQIIEAAITIPDSFERPFTGLVQLKRGPKAPVGEFKITADIGDCINGFLLTEPIESTWNTSDGALKTTEVKVLGFRWNQILMARAGRALRAGVWKADALTQLILRNDELRNAGDSVWQLAVMKTEPEGDFRSYRDQFASTPYEVSKAQWDFADRVLQGLRPVAVQMQKAQATQDQLVKAATSTRLPLVTAIRQQRIHPTFQFPTLLKANFEIQYKVAMDWENARLEMWAPEAMRAVVEIKSGQVATYYICDLQLSTAKASKHPQTGIHRWSGVAYSANPIEPEPIVANALHEQSTGVRKPQLGDVDPVVAHIAAQPHLNFVEKQLAIWLHNNPSLSTDAIRAIGKKFDDPILSSIPESILDDARLQLRSSRWQVEQLPEELQQGRIEEFFVGEWKPADFLQARAAAVNFLLPANLANPLIPKSDIEEYRRQMTLSFGGGIDIEQMSLSLFPDSRFEARGTYLDRPVAARGNWRWTGRGLDFPLWKDGKGNDPFLETGGRANLPMLLLADTQVIGEAATPSHPAKVRGAFLRKTSSEPNPSVAQSTASAPTTNPTPANSKDAALDEALKTVELQTQASAVSEKNTRVRSLSAAVAEGLVTLGIEVVDPLPKSEHFMVKQAVMAIRKTPTSERLNLKLLCAEPLQFDFPTSGPETVPIVLAYPRPEVLELSALQSEAKLRTRCFPLKWEGLLALTPLETAVPQQPDHVIAFLASSQDAANISIGDAEVQEYYAANWKKILNLREKAEKVFKANGLDQVAIQRDRKRWLSTNYFSDEVNVLNHVPDVDIKHCAREMGTAILFLHNPNWKAEELLRYANSKFVQSSLGVNGQEYLMKEFATSPDSGQAMRGHGANIQAFFLSKYCKEFVSKYPALLRSAPLPDGGNAFFAGRWRSVSDEKALQLFEQITPRTIEEKEAKADQKQRVAQGEPFAVRALSVAVTLLPDRTFDLNAMRAGVNENSTGFWQWDGAQLWIGTTSYSVVGNYLVKVRRDRSNVYGTFLEREDASTIIDEPNPDSMPSTNSTPTAAKQEGKSTSQTARVNTPSAPTVALPNSVKPELIVGKWQASERDRAVIVRATVMRRQVERMFGNAVRLNEDQQRQMDQLRSMAITEAAKDLQVPDVELEIEGNKTFLFRSNTKGNKTELNGRWSIRGEKLILDLDKSFQLELELVEGALYGETLQFGEVYLSRQ